VTYGVEEWPMHTLCPEKSNPPSYTSYNRNVKSERKYNFVLLISNKLLKR